MVHVSLRDSANSAKPGAGPATPPLRRGLRTPRVLLRPPVVALAAIVVVIALLVGIRAAVDAWNDNTVLSGLTVETTPIDLAIGGEALSIPANMIRSASARRGGNVERVDLAIHWPTLEGFSDTRADAFAEGAATAPIVYLTIMSRATPTDSTGRLESVYARFFVGTAAPGPNGLVGRQLGEESGYGGEIVYFAPAEAHPFVARCLADATPELPATCLRDIDIGRGLSLLYRFNRGFLEDWVALDAGMRRLAAGFLR